MYKIEREKYYNVYYYLKEENKLYYLYKFNNLNDIFILLAKAKKKNLNYFFNKLEKDIINNKKQVPQIYDVWGYEYLKYQYDLNPENIFIEDNFNHQFFASTYIHLINYYYNNNFFKYNNASDYLFKYSWKNLRFIRNGKKINYRKSHYKKLSKKEKSLLFDNETNIYIRGKRNKNNIPGLKDTLYKYNKSWKSSYKIKRQWMKNK